MSNADYIEIPLETDPDTLAQEGFDFLQSRFPDWAPSDGNLETVLIEALARMTAEARDVASAVPTDIFRYYGQLVSILPQDATFATATTTWTAINNSGYTIPAGTQLGVRISGDELIPFETVADVVIPALSTTATGVGIQAIEAGAAASGLATSLTVELIDPLDYISTIVLTTATSGGVDAETDDEYLNRLVLRLQLIAPRPILARDFAIFAQDIAGVERATAIDGYNPFHNYLTANTSSVETDVSGWANDVNATIARTTSQFLDGIASLQMTASSAADMSAKSTPQQAVVPGDVWSATAWFKTAVTGRTCTVRIRWYSDAGGTTAISDSASTFITDTTGGWTQASIQNAVAPINALSARVIVRVVSPANAEVHFVDEIVLRHGTGTDWIIGGTPELNNERMVTVVAVDSAGLAVSGGVKTAIDNYLEALREVNFVVWETDPTYTTIDVNFTAVALSGYDAALTQAAAISAIQSYLSPANWGLPDFPNIDNSIPQWINRPVIRYLELAQVVNEVVGIDYITALTLRSGSNSFAALDVSLGGTVALPLAGSITGTVT